MNNLILFALCAVFIRYINGAVLEVISVEPRKLKDALVLPEETINEDCHQPRETGRCFALFYRYAFNVESRDCEEFIYGGCEGNKNNFETKEECEAKCLKYFERSSEIIEGSGKVKVPPKD